LKGTRGGGSKRENVKKCPVGCASATVQRKAAKTLLKHTGGGNLNITGEVMDGAPYRRVVELTKKDALGWPNKNVRY